MQRLTKALEVEKFENKFVIGRRQVQRILKEQGIDPCLIRKL